MYIRTYIRFTFTHNIIHTHIHTYTYQCYSGGYCGCPEILIYVLIYKLLHTQIHRKYLEISWNISKYFTLSENKQLFKTATMLWWAACRLWDPKRMTASRPSPPRRGYFTWFLHLTATYNAFKWYTYIRNNNPKIIQIHMQILTYA